MIAVNHKEAAFVALQKRINGAQTYSEYICEYDLPVWQNIYPKNDVLVSTCPRLSRVDIHKDERLRRPYKLAIQYLHTYPHKDAVAYAQEIVENSKVRAQQIVFITAYRSYQAQLQAAGLKAFFLPVRVHTKPLMQYSGVEKYPAIRVLWFGNIYRAKRATFKKMEQLLLANGYVLDVLSENKLNGEPIAQSDVFKTVARYRTGIGVGQCALQMMGMGLRVLIAGDSFGGIVTNEPEFYSQVCTNTNGRVCTFDSNILHCMNYLQQQPDEDVYTPDLHELNSSVADVFAEIKKEVPL